MINKAILLTTASLLCFAQPAAAADYVFGQTGAVPENSWQTHDGGVTQIRLENGAIVGMVGKARFRVDSDGITVGEGAITVSAPGGVPVTVRFDGAGRAAIRGAASLSVQNAIVTGHVLQGDLTLANASGQQSFAAGSAWRMAAGSGPARIFAAAAQQAPGAVAPLKAGGLRAAAVNGLPVTLGFALGAIGAAGDVQQAARAIDARALRTMRGALPAGDVERLLGYSRRLGTILGTLRTGGSTPLPPTLVDTYLRHLARGGAAAEFQSTYNAVLTGYLQLLASGAAPAAIDGIDTGAINSYLRYLQDAGVLDQVVSAQQPVLAAYLQYLATGADPADFRFGQNGGQNGGQHGQMPPLPDYGTAIAAYLAYIGGGGNLADYDGLTTSQVQTYLAALESAGLLDGLFSAQASVLRSYLAFLQGGGSPGDFAGFAPVDQGGSGNGGGVTQPPLQDYGAAIAAYLAYIGGGGNLADYDGLSTDQVQSYLAALESAGLLDGLFSAQASVLRSYLAFLQGGGSPGDFAGFAPVDQGGSGNGDGVTQPPLQDYGAAIAAYLAYIGGGGSLADYDGLSTDQVQTYLAALESAGLLDGLFNAQASVLRSYLAFLQDGGSPGDFDGFAPVDQGLSQQLAQQYAAAVSAFAAYVQGGGLPSGYDELSGQLLVTYLQALSDAGLLAQLAGDQADFLSRYLAFLNDGGDIDAFPDLPTGLDDGAKLAVIDGFLDHIRANGVPSGYTSADFETLRAYFNDGASLALQQAGRAEDNALLNTYFNYVRFNNQDADAFPGLPALGGTVARYATAHSLNLPLAASTGSVSAGGYNDLLVLDADGAPVYSAGDALVEGPVVAQRVAGAQTVSTRVYGDRFTQNGKGFALGADQGMHFTTATPVTNVPADAVINYVLDSATSPTFNDGSSAPGTFMADIAVKYTGSQARMAAEGSVEMPGDATYTFSTPGGIAGLDGLTASFAISPDWYPIQQNADLTGTGKACVAGALGCQLYLAATPAGEGASALVLAYGSRSGGDGSIGFTGSAGFVADTGGGNGGNNGGDGQIYGSSVYAFQSAIYSLAGYPFLDVTSYFGEAELGEDGAIGTVSRNGSAIFDRETMALVESVGDEEVLLSRYGAGSYFSYGSRSTVDGAFLDLATVASPAAILPASGTATYALTGTFAPQTTTGLTDTSFDLSMAVAFGYTPRIAVEGVLGLDTDYTFSTPGGLAAVATGGAPMSGTSYLLFAPFTSGTGDFCASGASCNLRLQGQFADGFGSVAGYFRTLGSANVATGVYRLDTDNLANLSFDGGPGVTSGALTAPFAHEAFLPLTVDGGGSNIVRQVMAVSPLYAGVFDERGLVSLTNDTSNASANGLVYFDRGPLQTADLAGDADWQIGRFTGGLLEGVRTIYGADNGFSYALIAPLSDAPESGTITYALKGATRPVYSNEGTAPGTFAGAMGVQFGATPRVGVEGTITMPDATYSFQTPGGAANPAGGANLTFAENDGRAQLQFSHNLQPTVTGNGVTCTAGGSCDVAITGTVGGAGGSWASLGYVVYGDFAGAIPRLSGSAVFEGGEAVPAAPPLEGTAVANQITAYASSVIGIDRRQPTTVTYETASGAPIGYSFSAPNEEPTIGSASLHEEGSVAGIIGWARWAAGTTGGNYYQLGTVDLPANGGWHVVSGEPARNLPTSGTVTYALVGATNPTIRDGSLAPGSVTGSAAVAFGAAPRVGIDLDVSIGGSTYDISTAGGAANPASGMEVGTSGNDTMAFSDYDLTATGSGPVCSGSGGCGAVFTGFLAGEGASHIGLAYTFGNAGFDKQVDGTVVFGRN